MLAAAAVAVGLSGMSAEACNPFDHKQSSATKLPASMLAKNNPVAPSRPSIVGLWHVVHTDSSGNLFFESYDMWHSDGTEEEMPNLPPAAGALCLGTWTQSGKVVQLLTHVAFLYDLNNNFVGTMNLTESNKISKDGNSYKGTFDSKQYDTNGNFVAEVTGTSAADRLN
jgi:hypothetical protein